METAQSTYDADMPSRDTRKSDFARTLRGLLIERNMSQADLARATGRVDPNGEGLGRDSISNYFNGKTLPEPRMAKLLADALGVTIPELFPGAVSAVLNTKHLEVELRQAAGMPGKAWLRVDRAMSFGTAVRIIALIEEEDRK